MSGSGTLLDVLDAHVRDGRGDRPAVVDRSGPVTYAELAQAVRRRAGELRSNGCRPGTRIGVLMTTQVEAIVEFAAATAVHAAVLVLQNGAAADEKAATLSDFGADLVLGPDGAEHLRPVGTHGDDPAFAVSSSGTSGRPKVISREWAGTLENSATFARAFGIDVDDVVLTTSPLGHSYAIEAGTIAVLWAGACQLVPDGPLTPAQASALIEQHQPTLLQSVPVVLDWWGRGNVTGSGPWRKVVSAGENLPAATAALWRDAGVPVHDHYGNSELGQLTLGPGDDTGLGAPLPGVGLRAGDSAPASVTARFPGLRPVRVEHGERVELTDADGWVATGDVGVVGPGGLRLTGRNDAVINIGGNKVSPDEVEAAMRGLPGVRDCAVVGRDGPGGRQQVWAFVEALADGFDAAALRRGASRVLTPFKVPAVIRRVDELPRTGSGKVRRGLLIDDQS